MGQDNILQQILSELRSVNGRLGNLEEGQAKLEADVKDLKHGQVKLEAGQANLEANVKDLMHGQAKLEAGQAKLEVSQSKLEAGQAKLEAGQAEINTKLDNLTTYVHAINHVVNEDHNLLKAVDKKVTSLASISEAHEQKFQKLKAL